MKEHFYVVYAPYGSGRLNGAYIKKLEVENPNRPGLTSWGNAFSFGEVKGWTGPFDTYEEAEAELNRLYDIG